MLGACRHHYRYDAVVRAQHATHQVVRHTVLNSLRTPAPSFCFSSPPPARSLRRRRPPPPPPPSRPARQVQACPRTHPPRARLRVPLLRRTTRTKTTTMGTGRISSSSKPSHPRAATTRSSLLGCATLQHSSRRVVVSTLMPLRTSARACRARPTSPNRHRHNNSNHRHRRRWEGRTRLLA